MMTTYAHVRDGVVVEKPFTPPPGFGIADCFHPDLLSRWIAVPSGITVQQGWTYDGASWSAPSTIANAGTVASS